VRNKNCLLARYLKSVENFKENPIREPNNFSSGNELFVSSRVRKRIDVGNGEEKSF
jgi:hypothetical protein